MPRTIIFLLLCINCLGLNAQDGAKEAEPRQYKEFLELLSQKEYYAVEQIGGRQVLLVSDGTFAAGDANDSTARYALYAQLYCLDSDGKILCLGEVHSQSTGTPLVISKGTIIGTGHHFVRRYGIEENPLSLYLIEDAEEQYDKRGKADYLYENREKGVYHNSRSSREFDKMIEEAASAKPVIFRRKPSC